MNKSQYIAALTGALRGKLARHEIDDIVRDYNEFFEDGKIQGRAEEQTAEELGNPLEVAKQLLSDERYTTQNAKKPTIDFDGIKDKFTAKAEKTYDNFKASNEKRKAAAPPKPPKEPNPPRHSNDRNVFYGIGSFFLKFMAFLISLPLALIYVSVFVVAIILGISGIIAVFAGVVAVTVVAPLLSTSLLVCIVIWLFFGISLSITIILACFYFISRFYNLLMNLFGARGTANATTSSGYYREAPVDRPFYTENTQQPYAEEACENQADSDEAKKGEGENNA